MTQQATLQNPFVGLRPYQSDDSLFYFGRNEQTKTLLRLLHQHRFVAVVGSSGAGKSSLIRAGLIPQLEAGFLVQERDQWLVATAKPGDAPLANLVDSLLDITGSDHVGTSHQAQCLQLTDDIEEHGTQALIEALKPQLANSDSNLFILIDQFEELFRFGLEKGHTSEHQQAEQFVALLLSMSRQELPIYVCLTMRSDFLGDCDAFYGLPEAINKSQFLVPRLTRSQRQEVISNPVNLAGAQISPRLVDKLLNENIDTRDDLPILQHTLMRTWDVWQESGGEGLLDIEHYEKAHTIHHALDRHADEALNELDYGQQHIAKILFQALTTTDASNRHIKRSARLHEIAAIANVTPQSIVAIINCFSNKSRSFLMLSSKNMKSNPLIDISHESLIRQWKTLAIWTDEEQKSMKTFLRLVETSKLYNKGKASLYSGSELVEVLKWTKEFPNELALKSWARKYVNDFEKPLTFLKESYDKFLYEKEALEREKQHRRNTLRSLTKKFLFKQTFISMTAVALLTSLLGGGYLSLYDERITSLLLAKYEEAANALILTAPIFEDDIADPSELSSLVRKLNLSHGFEDEYTKEDYFAYIQDTTTKKIIWSSKLPENYVTNDTSTGDNLVRPSDFTTIFQFTDSSSDVTFKKQILPGNEELDIFYSYYVYSKVLKADMTERRIVVAESTMKYSNDAKHLKMNVMTLFFFSLIVTLLSHLSSFYFNKYPVEKLE